MKVTQTSIRIAALACLFDVVDDPELQEKITNEIWCLQNYVPTDGLHDITLASVSTTDIINRVLDAPSQTRDRQVALLLCTLHEVS